MSLYDELKALGWSETQLATYYPELKPGDTTWEPTVSAAERSYQDSMATFERVSQMYYNRGLEGPVTEYQKQLVLELHPEIFSDVDRATTEIGLPTDRSFAESHPELATGTRYREYGTTAPAFLPQHELFEIPSPDSPSGQQGDWGDMLALGITGLVAFVGLGMLLSKR